MKSTRILLGCLLVLILSGSGAQAESADKTLSPYFFIQGNDSGTDRFPLKDTHVSVHVSGVIAHVTVKQTYANMGDKVISGRYIFPGSTKAAVHGMKMTIGERITRAVIKEKQEAKKIYEQAKAQGKNAALLEEKRPNVFSMQVANIMPGDTIETQLEYTEILVPENGTYSFVYPTVVGPRYSCIPDDAANKDEQWINNPYLKKGRQAQTDFDIDVSVDAGMKIQQISCATHDTAVNYDSAQKARVRLKHPEIFSGDRDYIIKYRLQDRAIATGLILEQSKDEQFFLLMAQPPDRVTPEMLPPREYTFIVDVSGSMHGFPLDTAKKLMNDLVTGLKPTDTFNVMAFAGDSSVLFPACVPATPQNIRTALNKLGRHQGGGSTKLLSALKKAIQMEHGQGVARTVVIITDGYIGGEKKVFAEIDKNLNSANVFAFGIGSSVNRHLIEGIANAGRGEPFVVTSPDVTKNAAKRFCRYVSQPVLTDISIQAQGVRLYDVEPPAICDLFANRPVIVFGKWRGPNTGSITLNAMGGSGPFSRTFHLAKASVFGQGNTLAYLWARTKIARIADYSTDDSQKMRRQVVDLGLTYNLLTRYTSFVAVDEQIRNEGTPGQDIDQPLPLPKGVSELAVSGSHKLPEPGLAVFALLFAAAGGVCFRQRRKNTNQG